MFVRGEGARAGQDTPTRFASSPASAHVFIKDSGWNADAHFLRHGRLHLFDVFHSLLRRTFVCLAWDMLPAVSNSVSPAF
jgi:hypothetical protein